MLKELTNDKGITNRHDSRMKLVKDKGSITWIIIDFKGFQQWQGKISNRVDDRRKIYKISNGRSIDQNWRPIDQTEDGFHNPWHKMDFTSWSYTWDNPTFPKLNHPHDWRLCGGYQRVLNIYGQNKFRWLNSEEDKKVNQMWNSEVISMKEIKINGWVWSLNEINDCHLFLKEN